jgi:hypothetical protein
VRGAASNLGYSLKAVHETRDIRVFEIRLTYSELAVAVVPHGVDLSARLHNEGGMILTTADLPDQNIETAHFGHRVLCLFKTDSELTIVVIYLMKCQ